MASGNITNSVSREIVRKYILIFLGWSALVAGSLAWNIHQLGHSTSRTAAAAVRASLNKDIAFREWATSHGGVYVPPTAETPPNPYLKLPDRDVVTTNGKALTLMNPAYMIRELHQRFPDQLGVKTHLTSLKLLNPDNAPDEWEAQALHGFDKGNLESLEESMINGQPYLRLMLPFKVKQGCLLCHAHQGYKVGDIRGGISASVPLAPYIADSKQLEDELKLSHGIIWIFGIIGVLLAYYYEYVSIIRRKRVEQELLDYKGHLEEIVQQRTTDLVLARNAAEAANKAKSIFLASMSHELRTPLNAILGFSSLMRKDPTLGENQQQNLEIINRSGTHLLTLINDVLEMSKIEAGRVQFEIAPLDLGSMVRDVTDMMEIRAREKGLRLLIDQSSHFPRYINGDEARLRQILINLIGNAIKFTQQGGVTVRLGTKQNTISHLIIEVEDSGPGISKEDQQNLFQPFVQLGKQTDNKGTGLGLSITRQFIELMGGSISLESTLGKGSLFRVDLPLKEISDEDTIKPDEPKKGDVTGVAPDQPAYRILIAEDQQENRFLLEKLMEPLGFPVKMAENGEQAVQLFQSFQPHLIWMDRRMPVMDGMEAAKKIRQLPGGDKVKIIAVTASAFMEQRDEMLQAGMDDFVRKPYRFNEIYESLGKQLNVQYTYADSPKIESTPVLTAERMLVLPLELRKEIHDALESLESEHIAKVLGQVLPHDPELHKILTHLVNDFNYPAILKALQINQA